MVELKEDTLQFRFPEVHADATLRITFQRTLRIPDDGTSYPLPPGLGLFPLRHVDDFAARVPPQWLTRGGIMLPMYQSEAMWLSFHSPEGYPFAVKIAAGKINAVTGAAWTDEISGAPQDYVAVPDQPWLDGWCVKKGVIRQFVAMPLGSGYSAEEQVTGHATHGGIQLLVHPLRRALWKPRPQFDVSASFMSAPCLLQDLDVDMGLGAGGTMNQEVYDDDRAITDYDRTVRGRCFVHLANSATWHRITGEAPPTRPLTAQDYTSAGMPWFDYYGGDGEALEGGTTLKGLKSVATLAHEMNDVALQDNETVVPQNIVKLRAGLAQDEVRTGAF